jgi:hypothetical protein
MTNNWIPSMWDKKYASEGRCSICGDKAKIFSRSGENFCADCNPYDNVPCQVCGAPGDMFTRSGESFCNDCDPYEPQD